VTESTITLEQALKLLDLPREIGRHPADGEPIVANFGRFGPYVKHGDEFRSLASDEEVFSVSLDRAVDLLQQPKRSRKRQATRAVLYQIGAHPESGATLQVLAGRYGPYVTDGKTNASLPKTADPTKLTLEEAMGLLKAREEAGPSKRVARGRTGTAARRSRRKIAAAS
jgi:DNA topoisomerase I